MKIRNFFPVLILAVLILPAGGRTVYARGISGNAAACAVGADAGAAGSTVPAAAVSEPQGIGKISGVRSKSDLSAGTMRISWNPADGADSYRVSWKVFGAKRWKEKTVSSPDFLLRHLRDGSAVTLRVTPESRAGETPAEGETYTGYFLQIKVKARKPAAGEQAFAARWRTVRGVTGYLVSCSESKDFRSGTFPVKVVGARRYSVKIRRKMTGGAVYYVRVRAYRKIRGKLYFSGWSDTVAAKYRPNGRTIVIDPGHQLHAVSALEPIGPGAREKKKKVSGGTMGRWSRLPEYELNLRVGLKLRDELISRGYRVVMTRTTNRVNLSNIQRAKIANRAHADAFLRIHANGSTDRSRQGAFTICQTRRNRYVNLYRKSCALAKAVIRGIGRSTGRKTRGVWRTDRMTGINWSKVPVTIVEMGYMTNRKEDLLLADGHYQDKIVDGIADGVDRFFRED